MGFYIIHKKYNSYPKLKLDLYLYRPYTSIHQQG
mgnify:CR=1 FL=1